MHGLTRTGHPEVGHRLLLRTRSTQVKKKKHWSETHSLTPRLDSEQLEERHVDGVFTIASVVNGLCHTLYPSSGQPTQRRGLRQSESNTNLRGTRTTDWRRIMTNMLRLNRVSLGGTPSEMPTPDCPSEPSVVKLWVSSHDSARAKLQSRICRNSGQRKDAV